MSYLLWIPLLVGCATLQGPPPVASGAEASVVGTPAGVPPVSFVPLEERVNVLIAEAQDTDRRDRLIAARDLMQTMRNKDAIAQRKVYDYLDQVLKIEERARPASIGIEPIRTPIQEETLGGATTSPLPPLSTAPLSPPALPVDPTPTIAQARVALSEARYLDAVSLLSSVTTPEATALRKEAVDGWARAERERAGHMFLEARQLPPGGERIASLRAARTALAAINERFPENAYASQIAENIAKVDADLATGGARP
ncbi:MAG: hypothetical protein Q8P41_04440 [Pseudomonadota bacterium]|nr:hypothetical protein [Pseudomonadota bacterium]